MQPQPSSGDSGGWLQEVLESLNHRATNLVHQSVESLLFSILFREDWGTPVAALDEWTSRPYESLGTLTRPLTFSSCMEGAETLTVDQSPSGPPDPRTLWTLTDSQLTTPVPNFLLGKSVVDCFSRPFGPPARGQQYCTQYLLQVVDFPNLVPSDYLERERSLDNCSKGEALLCHLFSR